jgi:hypothetical protein
LQIFFSLALKYIFLCHFLYQISSFMSDAPPTLFSGA